MEEAVVGGVLGPIDRFDDVVVDELVDRIRSIVAGTAAAQGVEAEAGVMGQSATLTRPGAAAVRARTS
ncbi:hypothetical protein EV643_110219 [Kribbella sp. VKM Ac-2527]|uniref:Uncharacterized protein n=1 Tax=Kribbella caucasensis TaxID=2512215 RepID=A0A4R6KFF6_9ACTN|nr:hypothetical protein [Kribbella sp. VKM Ac-2527]TDO46836.1 hypothetical protein EV643_110219 [Kribbella sp. VKM Ac-2527]